MCQIDDETVFGRMFRFYLEFEEGDLERLQTGGVIELSVVSSVMVPVSVAVHGGRFSPPDNTPRGFPEPGDDPTE